MGCQYCSSGLGLACQGPDGLDDLEAGCTCECHDEQERFEEVDFTFPEEFEDCYAQVSADMQAEIWRLTAENAELKAQLRAFKAYFYGDSPAGKVVCFED